MIQSLKLANFKNFKDASLKLGRFTVLVGTNASGKSNVRDAIRFLHGVGRGYSLAEILGEKWGAGGELQWKGIRGGPREISYHGLPAFSLSCRFGLRSEYFLYDVTVDASDTELGPVVAHESFRWKKSVGYETVSTRTRGGGSSRQLAIRYDGYNERLHAAADCPVLTQFARNPKVKEGSTWRLVASKAIEELVSMRFLELSPDAMRMPSVPGQKTLGDRGENLSSVLHAICQDEAKKRALVEWLCQLTPLDVTDFDFVPDQTGKILVSLVESNGQRTSAYSASDGTLRFLGIIAALMAPDRVKLYFLEEIDNGIHPTRLALLLQLIEQHVRRGDVQVVATTHSPQLLGMLSATARENAVLVYRLEDATEARIQRIMEIPTARAVLEHQNLSRLHESGWLENVVAFSRPEEDDA